MTTEVNHYRVYCTTESAYVYKWDSIEPTVCPNNNTHTIDAALTTIVESIATNTVKAEENSEGDFETSHIIVNIPTGTPGDVTTYDVSWPMDIMLWKTELSITSDMIGDEITVVAAPETTIGVITVLANAGVTTISVNSTVTANIYRGLLVVLDDGVNKNVVGRCTAVDKINGTISFQTPTTNSYSPGTPVKIGIYVLNKIQLFEINTMKIGDKGIKGKLVPAGTILRVYYTNNSGTSKVIRWRPEIYSQG